MALKDWRRVENKSTNVIKFEKKRESGNFINVFLNSKFKWTVYIALEDEYKDFRQKSQALLFAKQYMRKH